MLGRSKFEIAGRTAFITGAARGIGAETAVRLHSRGANVALVGLEPDKLEELEQRLGDRAMAIPVDVTDYGGLQRAVAATVSKFGGIDIAVANAGIHNTGALATAPIEQVERTIEVNLFGVLRTNRAVLPEIVSRRGYLLNISSLSAITHAPLMGPYTASKAGVEAMTDALRVETAPSGARVGCAYFGFIDTDLTREAFEQPANQALQALMGPFSRTVPLKAAIDAIERGIERRKARVWAPRTVGPLLYFRSIVQPVIEWRTRHSRALKKALRLADEAAAGAGAHTSEPELLETTPR